jgi:TolB-like protein
VVLSRLKRTVMGVAAVGAVLGGLVGYWNAFHAVKGASTSAASAAPASPPAVPMERAQALSILVLPFANQTGDTSKAYIADAMTSSITADLSRIRDAVVIPVSTAMTYKDRAVAVQQIGREAGVRFVLSGSVVAGGDLIRIQAQLADADAGVQLWSETFDGSMADLFALQDQVTTRIGNSIGREMLIAAARSSETRRGNVQAADLVLRARALGLKPQSREVYDQTEALLRQALALQPGDAAIQFSLAVTIMLSTDSGYWQEPEPVRQARYAQARELVNQAAQADAADPRLYQVRGLDALNRAAIGEARQAFETWLSLAPKSGPALNNLALTYMDGPEGAKKAIELLTQAIALDPKHPQDAYLPNLGRAHFIAGNGSEAITWLQRSLQANPRLGLAAIYLALARAEQGDLAAARAFFAQARQQYPNFSLRDFERDTALDTPAYRDYRTQRLLPLWQQAGGPM